MAFANFFGSCLKHLYTAYAQSNRLYAAATSFLVYLFSVCMCLYNQHSLILRYTLIRIRLYTVQPHWLLRDSIYFVILFRLCAYFCVCCEIVNGWSVCVIKKIIRKSVNMNYCSSSAVLAQIMVKRTKRYFHASIAAFIYEKRINIF